MPELPSFLGICPQCGATGDKSSDFIYPPCCGLTHLCSSVFLTLSCVSIVCYRCGGTVGAIFTCPLEVIKTRLQSSKLAFRAVYYPQVQLGTISGEGMVRPTSVSPGLFSVLKWVLLPLSSSFAWHQWSEFRFLCANMECRFCSRHALEGFMLVGLLHSVVERQIILLRTYTYSGLLSVTLNFHRNLFPPLGTFPKWIDLNKCLEELFLNCFFTFRLFGSYDFLGINTQDML